jgi:nucleotide-binding universal stress UspA family protein
MINLKTKKIIVPFDFSKTAENAVKHAAFIAAFTKGELILVYVQKKNDVFNIILPELNIKKPSVISNLLSEKLAQEALRVEQNYKVKTSSFFSIGSVPSELVNISNEMDADLIVMGTQGEDSDTDLFVGNNTYRTLTKSDLPILTVRTSPTKKGFSTILLPIDLSYHTRQKVNIAIQMAKLFSAQICILALYNESEKTDKFKLDVYVNQIEKEGLKKKVSVTSLIEETDSKIKRTLLYAKKINADIIIAMTDQNAEFKTVLLGNYIHQLINNSKIPVLCIKPELGEMIEGETPGVPF